MKRLICLAIVSTWLMAACMPIQPTDPAAVGTPDTTPVVGTPDVTPDLPGIGTPETTPDISGEGTPITTPGIADIATPETTPGTPGTPETPETPETTPTPAIPGAGTPVTTPDIPGEGTPLATPGLPEEAQPDMTPGPGLPGTPEAGTPVATPDPDATPDAEAAGMDAPADMTAFEGNIQQFAAGELDIDTAELRIVEIEAVEWADACLGVAAADEFCAMVITPGYRVIVQIGDDDAETYTFHTNQDATNIRMGGEEN
jgi:hypothetical protein